MMILLDETVNARLSARVLHLFVCLAADLQLPYNAIRCVIKWMVFIYLGVHEMANDWVLEMLWTLK